jgi:hypothetical protein
MVNEIIKYLNSIGEVNLSAQKIELAGVNELTKANDDVLKALKTSDKLWRDYQDYLTRADKPYGAMIKSRQDLINAQSKLVTTLKQVEQTAKELGVSADVIPIYKGSKQNVNTSNEIIDTIASFKDPSTFQ